MLNSKVRRLEREIAALNDVIDEQMKHEEEQRILIMHHHEVNVVHAQCGQDAVVREWGKLCPVCNDGKDAGYLGIEANVQA